MRVSVCCAIAINLLATLVQSVRADDLVVDNTTLTLSDVHRYDHVCVINGGKISVAPYSGGDKTSTGDLELIAASIYVDASSSISARGAGYQAVLCGDGAGPTATAGGRGGCSVMDSAGGGAHFGRGGRGTVDNPTSGTNLWQDGFPSAFEDDCDLDVITSTSPVSCEGDTQPNGSAWPSPPGNPYRSRWLCWKGPTPTNITSGTTFDMTCSAPGGQCEGPSIAGVGYWHNIYSPEFGAAGGDKGCRDGDGRTVITAGGSGGGRVVLVGLADRLSQGGQQQAPAACGSVRLMAGTVQIDGVIDAGGKRGCGIENDSGGGGAGGSVLIVGDDVIVNATATVSAAGGLGGDSHAASSTEPDHGDCAPGAQSSGTCDDCGGGGGGGIVSVLSVTRTLDPRATFNVNGALGGTCDVCKGEAGGGAGELQLDGAYVGEYCDGFDNDFDGNIDEGLGNQSCGLGSCATNIASCSGGAPPSCTPNVSGDASCKNTAVDARPRVAVIVDTSASMLLDLSGYPTFGDGSAEHPGISTTGDSASTDSRLYLARESIGEVMSAYPEIDFALARYHQDQGLNRSCQTAAWFECQGLVASYDDPTDNSGAHVCDVAIGPDPDGNGPMSAPTVSVAQIPGPDVNSQTECINYAGSCGPPRRGADILSGFGTPVRDMVRWLDGRETAFDPTMTPGDVCLHSQGKDCELRATGPTPLAGSLQAIMDYVQPIRAEDTAASCRGYDVILVTDGAESCNGDPVTAAQQLHDMGINVNVVAVSVLDSEKASLNAIAAAGGTSQAVFVTQPEQLVPALTSIIAGAIRYESCNGQDDDCDGKIDEDFPGLGSACDDGQQGICKSTGKLACNAAQDGTECKIDSQGQTAGTEVCNALDDDCDGAVDEGLDCTTTTCTPTGGEICNGKDDDCDGKVDETDPAVGSACGNNMGECRPGTMRCAAGMLRCVGGVLPTAEQCNGKDDDCNGQIDDDAPCPGVTACIQGACRNPCTNSEFTCPLGQLCMHSDEHDGDYCVPSACALCKSTEVCENDTCVDPCADVACGDGLYCVRGECRDCTVAGCANGQICYQKSCQDDPCAAVSCDKGSFCYNGSCVPLCDDSKCGSGQACDVNGRCASDPCAGVTCAAGQACRDGKCASDPCSQMNCQSGDTCISGLGCVPDPCAVTSCSAGTECSVGSAGQPRCTTNGGGVEHPPPVYVSTGGSGLTSCSVSRVAGARDAGGAWLMLFAAFGLGLRRRRRRVGLALRQLALLGLALLAGCRTDAICLDCFAGNAAQNGRGDAGTLGDGGDNPATTPDGGGAGDSGDAAAGGGGAGGTTSATCTLLGDEVCNHLDDDCDGKIDEDFDFQTNVRHCGGCDQPCLADNAETSCEQGQCKVGACLTGFADLDGQPGCEYRCPAFPIAAEDCNGIDDDCDGRVDETLTPPAGSTLCRHTAGTPCANVQVVCDTRAGRTTWYCDYSSDVDFDPIVPDGIRGEEERCDGKDNDCDGLVDEPWPVGQACDDGKIGACKNGGALVCSGDEKGVQCDLSLPPDPLPGAGPDAVELCNDVDDNCDGIIDNPDPADPKHVVDAMVKVSRTGHNDYYIYTYEASRPDASASAPGIASARACSRSGAQPWTLVSYDAAEAACAASGKRLCSADEWQAACEGDAMTAYPYGPMYMGDLCNGADHDTQPGGAIDNAVVPTASMTMCVSALGVYDLSGNVKEWTSQMDTGGYEVRGGSYDSPQLGLTCQTTLSQATATTVLAGLGFRCCSDTAP